MDDFMYDAEDTDDDVHDNDDINNNNPLSPIIAAIQKQQARETARLTKNNTSDSMQVIVHDYVKLAGVQTNPAK